MNDAMEILWEALDGILDEMSDEELLTLAGHAYVNGNDGVCPLCESWDIRAHQIETADGAVWSDIECPSCGANWQEVFDLVECDFQFGHLPQGWRETFLQGRKALAA